MGIELGNARSEPLISGVELEYKWSYLCNMFTIEYHYKLSYKTILFIIVIIIILLNVRPSVFACG